MAFTRSTTNLPDRFMQVVLPRVHRSTQGIQVAMTEVQTLNSAAMRLSLDARAECLLVVRQALEGAARAHGISGQLLDDLKLAATEASSNVVKYAYPNGDGKLWVEFDADERRVCVAVCDSGFWREPPEQVDPVQSGMGIPLIEAVTDSCKIDSDGEGTRVVMTFDRINREATEVLDRDV